MNSPTRVLLTEPKNITRIMDIRTNIDANVVAIIRSPTIRRWLIREFYFITGRLFILNNGHRTRTVASRKLAPLMDDLRFASGMVGADAEHYGGDLNDKSFPPIEYELRIVSRDASTLYRELVRADQAIIRLYMAEFEQKITFAQRENMIRPVLIALLAIKHHALGHEPKTAEQLAAEIQIQ